MGWGTTLGAIGGGALGFAVGGPAGAAVGAGLGGSIGGSLGGELNREDAAQGKYQQGQRKDFLLPDYKKTAGQYSDLANQYGGRMAPQAGQSGFRGDQRALGQMLAREAQGQGIGQQLIRNQAQAQADQAYRQQLSAAASARPGQGALAARQAMMNAGNAASMVGGQSAGAAGQYQLGAMQNYGGFLQGARGQDDAMAQFNVDARLRQMGINDQAQLQALQQRLQAQQLQQQGAQEFERQRTQRYGAMLGTPTSSEQLLSGITGALGGYAMLGGGKKG